MSENAENQIIETDILIIGSGPAGLSAAIHFTDLICQHNKAVEARSLNEAKLPLNVMLLEKAHALGNHTLSGAVINPVSLRQLLPDIADKDMPFESPVLKEDIRFFTKDKSFKLPFKPPYMSNKGNYISCLGKVVRWLGGIAEKKGAQVFTGISACELLFENGKVAGVRTCASGIDKHGMRLPNYQPPADVRAKITILAEGVRGYLTKALIKQLSLSRNRNPQVYSLGVKEVWKIPEGVFKPGHVMHTLGYPLDFNQFGGGFVYGLSKDLIAVGFVVGLDYNDPTFDIHHALQIYKMHPHILRIIKDGKIVRYGAKTIPEGGFFSMPQLYHDNVMIVGDSAGFTSVPSLKGVHLAIQSGMLAAKTAFDAIKKNNTSAGQLAVYEELFKKSPAYKELYAVRNFRQGFKTNLLFGMLQFGAQILTGGRGLSLSGRQAIKEDYKHCRLIKELNGRTFLERNKDKLAFDDKMTFSKEADLFYSGTKHNEEQPSHIVVPSADVCQECIKKYNAPCQRFCPSDVFEITTDPKTGKKELVLHPSNCLHCKTCDIKDPFENAIWNPPYGGDGPRYESM
ncbi:MAG: electron-transfer flavoprotein:ubiquinone oxidoreductase [Candidatus Omnitrophota bacterium]|nr:electron-transfer flavoprotein:ubiquinone oxidoreductase [Candidatus Omnitrophota bacterium]